jgi:hypothetical protein
MNRWLLINKKGFAEWLANNAGLPEKDLSYVGEPNIYPQIIVWHCYFDAEGKKRLAHTFVMPHDFEYYEH